MGKRSGPGADEFSRSAGKRFSEGRRDDVNVKQVYERVMLVATVNQRQFFDRLNDVLVELGGLYGEVPKLLYKPEEDGSYPDGQWVKNLDEELEILPLYHAALADGVLFLSGAGEVYQTEFMRKAKEAYLKYWNVDAKGRRVKYGKRQCECSD